MFYTIVYIVNEELVKTRRRFVRQDIKLDKVLTLFNKFYLTLSSFVALLDFSHGPMILFGDCWFYYYLSTTTIFGTAEDDNGGRF